MAYFRTPKVTKEYNTVDVVAAAIIAYERNGNKIEKYNYPAMAEMVREDGSIAEAQPEVKTNRTIMFEILDGPDGVITDDLRAQARDVIDNINGQVTMALLGGKKASDFVLNITKAFELDRVPQFNVGLLAYAPSTYKRNKEREVVTEKIGEARYTSQPLGAVGTKVAIAFNYIEHRYLEAYEMYAVFGDDGKGNLVSFLTRHEALAASGNITGKIKKTGNDQWRDNAMVTALNYVKRA